MKELGTETHHGERVIKENTNTSGFVGSFGISEGNIPRREKLINKTHRLLA